MRPESLEGDWSRLYSDFPDVYAEWARVLHEPEPVDVIAARWELGGATVVDVGSGTGRSTFALAGRASWVLGVEPSPAMRALAEEQALAAGVANVAFAAGSAGDLPCDDGSADVVVCITTDFWPPETVVPAFAREADRVLRPGGVALVLATPPGWYGGELHRLVSGDQAYEETLDALLREAGFDRLDFETVQDYGTPEHAVATYGFIFGSAASRRLRERRQSRISWRWRLHHRRR